MKHSTFATTAALLLLGAGAAAAQGGQGQGDPARAAVREACAADMRKLCADKTGPDRRQCMMDHRADLSDGCKSAMAAMRRQMQGAPRPQR
jgi:hypothetical protein